MTADASVERTLGLILGKLEGMEERMEKADTSRAGVHRRLDDLLQRTTHLEGEVASTKAKVEGMEKVTVEVTTLRTKAQGAGTLGKWLLQAGWFVLSAAGGFAAAYTWLTGRPPP